MNDFNREQLFSNSDFHSQVSNVVDKIIDYSNNLDIDFNTPYITSEITNILDRFDIKPIYSDDNRAANEYDSLVEEVRALVVNEYSDYLMGSVSVPDTLRETQEIERQQDQGPADTAVFPSIFSEENGVKKEAIIDMFFTHSDNYQDLFENSNELRSVGNVSGANSIIYEELYRLSNEMRVDAGEEPLPDLTQEQIDNVLEDTRKYDSPLWEQTQAFERTGEEKEAYINSLLDDGNKSKVDNNNDSVSSFKENMIHALPADVRRLGVFICDLKNAHSPADVANAFGHLAVSIVNQHKLSTLRPMFEILDALDFEDGSKNPDSRTAALYKDIEKMESYFEKRSPEEIFGAIFGIKQDLSVEEKQERIDGFKSALDEYPDTDKAATEVKIMVSDLENRADNDVETPMDTEIKVIDEKSNDNTDTDISNSKVDNDSVSIKNDNHSNIDNNEVKTENKSDIININDIENRDEKKIDVEINNIDDKSDIISVKDIDDIEKNINSDASDLTLEFLDIDSNNEEVDISEQPENESTLLESESNCVDSDSKLSDVVVKVDTTDNDIDPDDTEAVEPEDKVDSNIDVDSDAKIERVDVTDAVDADDEKAISNVEDDKSVDRQEYEADSNKSDNEIDVYKNEDDSNGLYDFIDNFIESGFDSDIPTLISTITELCDATTPEEVGEVLIDAIEAYFEHDFAIIEEIESVISDKFSEILGNLIENVGVDDTLGVMAGCENEINNIDNLPELKDILNGTLNDSFDDFVELVSNNVLPSETLSTFDTEYDADEFANDIDTEMDNFVSDVFDNDNYNDVDVDEMKISDVETPDYDNVDNFDGTTADDNNGLVDTESLMNNSNLDNFMDDFENDVDDSRLETAVTTPENNSDIGFDDLENIGEAVEAAFL